MNTIDYQVDYEPMLPLEFDVCAQVGGDNKSL